MTTASAPAPLATRRADLLARLAQSHQYDLAVIGGGATGLGVALDAAARGFSVVTNSRGQVVRQAADLKPGQALHIRFAEGSADVRVNQQAQTDLFD